MCQCGEDMKRSLMHDQQLSEREKQSGVNSNRKGEVMRLCAKK